jgi:cell wall-associated NlpC family hydrolase
VNTFGLIFILGGVLLLRQVVTGRVRETPQDIRDITVNILNGDFTALSATLAQRGENAPPVTVGTVAAGGLTGGAALSNALMSPITGDLLAKCVELGNKARGYRLGATGPDFYDCSGLVWRAMQDLDYFKGPRFTTNSFVAALGNQIVKVTKPVVGDVALWPRHHMGIVSGPDQMYSAMSPSLGIGYSSITGASKSIGSGSPVYYRLSAIADAVGSK